jgi:hypothetical protein
MDERRIPRDSGRRLFDDADAARRFQRRLRETGPSRDRAGNPVHYDESGYPIERQAGLAARVRRLITG